MSKQPFSRASLAAVPLEKAWTIPAAWYTDPAVLELEHEAVFSQSWQLVGSARSLARPGDYRVEDIARAPVLLVRGKDDKRRAFYNVCRHRAGPVAAGQGNCKLLRCRYHGWVYQLDGRLHTAPEIGEIDDFDPADHGLVALEFKEVAGLAFVARKAGAQIGGLPIDDVFAEMATRVDTLDFGKLNFFRRCSYDMRCNWKVYVDNYLEGYHLPHVHPELTNILDYGDYKTETYNGYSLQFSEIETPTDAYGAGRAFYYFIFPNIMLNILPDRLQTNVVLPLAADRCRVIFDYYYPDIESAQAQTRIEEDIRFGDLVQEQDIAICEQVQQGLASGVYERGRLSVRREAGVHHFQELLKAAYRCHV